MVDPDAIAVFIPIAFFLAVVAAIGVVMYFRTEKAKAQSLGGGNYQRLAEEAVRGQRVLLEETQRMNATLKEIERLLREV
ncbi:MAG TPA: hypothetical protein VM370_02735 [Candidatus Thermoplasmatota archaeon]|nr:hypothetical protein [Candidatus Thermoplasmatota archaeon]